MTFPHFFGALMVAAVCLGSAHAAAPATGVALPKGGEVHKAASVHWSTHAARVADPSLLHLNPYLHPASLVTYAPGDYATLDGRNLVALSFDDGPDVVNTPKVLEILREAGVHATFFLIGQRVELHPGGTRQILEQEHEIGSHGYKHVSMARLADAALHTEMANAVAALRAVVPEASIAWFRPPKGDCDPRVVAEAAGYRLDTIRWDIDPADWKRGRTPSEVSEAVLSHLHPGAVVLLHSIHGVTVEALPTILREGAARGYRFVTVSEWWAASHPTVPTVAVASGQHRPEGETGAAVP